MVTEILRSPICRRSIVAIVLIGVSLLTQIAFAQNGLTKIADNVYCYVDTKPMVPQNSFAANTGVIIGQDGIVVIDTLMSAKEAQRLINDIRALSDKPIKYVVTTHYHADHVLGSSELVKLGATIISQDIDKNNLKKAGPTMLQYVQNSCGLTEKDLEGTTIAYPTLTFNEQMEIDLGDQTIKLIYPGPSHTNGSILVYLPGKKILFTGDILFTGYHPYIADGNIPSWLTVLDYIQKMDVDQIIPGHGPISGKKDIADMKEYLGIFDKNAKKLCAKSTDIEYIFSELKKVLPQRDSEMMIKENLRVKYLNNK
ncbi:Carbapenem-hydrolyzing beta-lactamase BlaB-1 precursor [Sporomusa ovata DSM 2662]|uniref:Metallo-beta-lactamase family protein n=1 Tax=Sporomusa ovata TaxID=2378 RepID=A0A0U1KTD8_9FIRM|nr:MBL fold metallo-hydrolase [Sporomusa ovata]EQB26587.1 beta-lactamase domain containing protein [Sporomusa ovata DSM 2662]CQR70676.1 Metallo-beta-lactamase family protein [Sporomusa ovata]